MKTQTKMVQGGDARCSKKKTEKERSVARGRQ